MHMETFNNKAQTIVLQAKSQAAEQYIKFVLALLTSHYGKPKYNSKFSMPMYEEFDMPELTEVEQHFDILYNDELIVLTGIDDNTFPNEVSKILTRDGEFNRIYEFTFVLQSNDAEQQSLNCQLATISVDYEHIGMQPTLTNNDWFTKIRRFAKTSCTFKLQPHDWVIYDDNIHLNFIL